MKFYEKKSVNKLQTLSVKFTQGLFTCSGGPRSSGVGFFCFQAPRDTKQKKTTSLDRGPPLHVNRVSDVGVGNVM